MGPRDLFKVLLNSAVVGVERGGEVSLCPPAARAGEEEGRFPR